MPIAVQRCAAYSTRAVPKIAADEVNLAFKSRKINLYQYNQLLKLVLTLISLAGLKLVLKHGETTAYRCSDFQI